MHEGNTPVPGLFGTGTSTRGTGYNKSISGTCTSYPLYILI